MTERELYKWLGKNVKIQCIENELFEGYVESFTRAIDNDGGLASIDIESKNPKEHICLYANEIKKIEIMTD